MSQFINWMKKYKYQIFAFLFAFVPRLLLNLYALPLRTLSDELATLAGGAFFGGKDWSGIVSEAGYYGFGFTTLFAPLFNISDEPILIYRLILIVESLMQALVALIAFYLLKRYFKIENKGFLTVTSVACSYMVVTRTMIVFNEHSLIFCSWLICLLLCRLVENQFDKRKKMIDTILIMLLMSYTLLLHTRALTYWIAFGIVYIAYLVRNHKSLIKIVPGIITAAMGIISGQVLVKWVQERVWLADGEGGLRNSKISVSSSILDTLLNADSWHAWVNIIIGQLNTVTLISGGMLIVGMLLMFDSVYGWMKQSRCVHIKMEHEKEGYDAKSLHGDIYAVLFLYFGLCIAMTIGGLSIKWLPQATQAMELGFASDGYGLKAVTYVRYIGPYLGPVLMLTLAYLYQKQDKFLSYYKKATVWIAGFQIFWVTCIIPYVYTNRNVIEVYLPFAFETKQGVEVGRMTFLPATAILLFIVVLNGIWLKKKQWKRVVFTITLLLIYQYCYNALAYDINMQYANYNGISKTYTMVSELRNLEELPEEIYVVDTRDKTNHQSYYLAQFYFQDRKVIATYPEADVEEAIVCLNSDICPIELVQDALYQCVKLDENEYVWIKGERLQEICRKLGYELQTPDVYMENGKDISFLNNRVFLYCFVKL